MKGVSHLISDANKARKLIGLALLLIGAVVTLHALTTNHSKSEGPSTLTFRELGAEDKRFKSPQARFPIDSLTRYEVTSGDASHILAVAGYRAEGERHQAIIFPARVDPIGAQASVDQGPGGIGDDLRHELWNSATKAILEHIPADALLLTWWDNAQRVHLLTGRHTWTRHPAKKAFSNEDEQDLWLTISGAFCEDGRLQQLARWLAMDTRRAVSELKQVLPAAKPNYLLITTDDLARLSEIGALSGRGLPLEAANFLVDGNIHGAIARVKKWANEGKGTGSYFVQRLGDRTIRVWRVMEKDAEDMLLVRLLPFSTSLSRPMEGVRLVYRSNWGGYLSVYQLVP